MHHLWHNFRTLHPGVPLGDRLKHFHHVYVLVRLFIHTSKPCLSGDRHQWGEVQGSIRYAGIRLVAPGPSVARHTPG